MYIRYIYRLAELHEHDQSYTEAGFTLLLHAKGLEVRSVYCQYIISILSVYCQYTIIILSVYYPYTVSETISCIMTKWQPPSW